MLREHLRRPAHVAGRDGMVRRPIPIVTVALALLVPTGLAAASRLGTGAQSIYAAFPLVSQGAPKRHRCSATIVTKATYKGSSTSPDPRLAGRATLTAELGVNPATGYGYANGTLVLRDARKHVRLTGKLVGVVSQATTVNGIVSGRIMSPNALLIANLTIVFNENYTFAAVRMGVESGSNSAVAYLAPRCG
jgi:hypothetical protein